MLNMLQNFSNWNACWQNDILINYMYEWLQLSIAVLDTFQVKNVHTKSYCKK